MLERDAPTHPLTQWPWYRAGQAHPQRIPGTARARNAAAKPFWGVCYSGQLVGGGEVFRAKHLAELCDPKTAAIERSDPRFAGRPQGYCVRCPVSVPVTATLWPSIAPRRTSGISATDSAHSGQRRKERVTKRRQQPRRGLPTASKTPACAVPGQTVFVQRPTFCRCRPAATGESHRVEIVAWTSRQWVPNGCRHNGGPWGRHLPNSITSLKVARVERTNRLRRCHMR